MSEIPQKRRLAVPEPARLPEIGRLRAGVKNERGLPESITQWRMTSSATDALVEAASMWGGTVQPWADGPEGQFELLTETAEIPALLPNVTSELIWSQAWELWSGGGCLRRCDGARCIRARKKDEELILEEVECLCNSHRGTKRGSYCELHTRVNVILGDLPGLGVWRLDTTSRIAASHLPAMIELLLSMSGGMRMVPVVLRLDRRRGKKGGQSTQFVVPVIDVSVRALDLGGPSKVPAIEAGEIEPEDPDPTDFVLDEEDEALASSPEDEAPEPVLPTEPEPPAPPPAEPDAGAQAPLAPHQEPSHELVTRIAASAGTLSREEKIRLRDLLNARGVEWTFRSVARAYGDRAADLRKLTQWLIEGGDLPTPKR